MKTGDIVTLEGKNLYYSNTYLVSEILGNGEVLLSHPAAPGCYIKAGIDALDKTPPLPKRPIEKCLDYAIKNKALLNYDLASEIDALCYYFLVHRNFSRRQKKHITRLCGQIASVKCDDLLVAIKTVTAYKALLDPYNAELYAKLEPVFSGKKFPPTNEQKFSVFNLAGFVMAQLENK